MVCRIYNNMVAKVVHSHNLHHMVYNYLALHYHI